MHDLPQPDVATGRYWDAAQHGSPITRPDFADPTRNPRAMGTTLWGDEPGEKLDDYTGAGTYRTPGGDTFSGSELPDYATFCQNCHTHPQSEFGEHGGIGWGGDQPHGLNSANEPNGSGTCPDWFACGNAAGWDGDDCVTEFKVDCIDAAARPQFQAYPCECNP